MNKSKFIFLIFLVVMKAQAQDYLISFAGSGATTAIGTIKVDNLTSGASLTLNGGDILHLSGSVGIGKLNSAKGGIKVYPNPITEESTVTFFASTDGNVVLDIVDLSGKTIRRTTSNLSAGTHSFRISGLGRGMYFLKVSGKNYSYSTKLLSERRQGGEVNIDYVSSTLNTNSTNLKSTSATVEMLYKTGDQLLYKGVSGIYSTIVPDVPTGNKTITFYFIACTDKNNNNYTIVKIGSQYWMAENLKTNKLSDGTAIPLVADNTAWSGLSTPGYCWYNNDSATYAATYGPLYNWYAVNNPKLAPAGWQLPTDGDWTTLTTFIGGLSTAGGKLKETGTIHWVTPNTDATNEYGFTAVPAGERFASGDYYIIGGYGMWWTSLANNATTAWYRYITYNAANVNRFNGSKNIGLSVRCVHY